MMVKFLPVCECGYIFRKGIVCEEIVSERGSFKSCSYRFTPERCPKCGEMIQAIEIDENLIRRERA